MCIESGSNPVSLRPHYTRANALERMQFESGSSQSTSRDGFDPVLKRIVFICVGDASGQMIRLLGACSEEKCSKWMRL